jgi:hypothetical protein
MFVRFRETRSRLQLSLVETHRASGRVRHDHIAGLGSVPVRFSIADRIEFWERLQQILARLSNLLGMEDHGKVLTAVHARIPMPTLDERRTAQIENAEADERFWSGLQEAQEEYCAGHKAMAVQNDRKAEEAKGEADKAAAKAVELRDRIARLKRGEDVGGGTGKRLSMNEITAIMGGKAAVSRARRVAAIDEAGAFEEMLEELRKRDRRAENAAINSVYRRRVLKG